MNISYTGKMERFYPAQTEKVDARFAKLAKLLDGKKGERSAHVILTKKRSFHHAEITVNYMDHSLVGEAQDNDQFLAVTSALDKLEKQVLKLREKRREVKSGPREVWNRVASAKAYAEPEPPPSKATPKATANGSAKRRVFRVDHKTNQKPMTLDEAMLAIQRPGDYVVYRDADKDCVSVLVMRPDGHFDLVEG